MTKNRVLSPPPGNAGSHPLTSSRPARAARWWEVDPRWYQIAVLAGLLSYGLLRLGFDQPLPRVLLILASALGAQYVCGRAWGAPAFEPKSALISALSLCLLLRTTDHAVAFGAAVLAISSKFLLRWGGKHVFNPTNFALVALLLLTDQAWVSPGQWGSVATFGFLLASLGSLVVTRARRADVTLAFLAAYTALLAARSLRLGEPLSIPLHRLESGALVLFAFFMISDPKTTPDSRAGRVLWAVLVAFGAYTVQFRWFRTNGLLWSLACFSFFVPVIDWLLPGRRYQWETTGGAVEPETPPVSPRPLEKGEGDEPLLETTSRRRGRMDGRDPVRPRRVRVLRFLRREG